MLAKEIFTGEEQDKFLEVARRCTAKEKALPTNASLAAFSKAEGNTMGTSEVAVVVKACLVCHGWEWLVMFSTVFVSARHDIAQYVCLVLYLMA